MGTTPQKVKKALVLKSYDSYLFDRLPLKMQIDLVLIQTGTLILVIEIPDRYTIIHFSHVALREKAVFWVSDRTGTSQTVQLQKMARGLKF